jgi:hypothetical protein
VRSSGPLHQGWPSRLGRLRSEEMYELVTQASVRIRAARHRGGRVCAAPVEPKATPTIEGGDAAPEGRAGPITEVCARARGRR